MRRRLLILALSVVAALGSRAAGAGMFDMTAINSTATVNGAIFWTPPDDQSTGTGAIDSFVRMDHPQNEGPEEGYNTSDRGVQFNENTSPTFTRDLLLSELPSIFIDGVEHYEFILDFNQNTGGPPGSTNHFLSLDRIQIFSGADQATETLAGDYETGGISSSPLGSLGSLSAPIYSLDGSGGSPEPGDNWLKLDYDNAGGSGDGIDVVMYVPKALFVEGPSVYLYSRFGDNFIANDGFEEWAVRELGGVPACPPGYDCEPDTPVPEPGTLALFAVGLLGAGLTSMRRRRSK